MHRFRLNTAPKNNEDGFVLALGLFTMLLLTVIGISATTTTNVELQTSRADRAYTKNFYQTDGGVQYILASIKSDLQDPDDPVSIEDINPSNYSVPAGFSFTVTPDSDFGAGPYSFTVTGTGSEGAETSISITFDVSSPNHPAFGVGIVTDGDLTIHGAPIINGGMHANGDISQSGAGLINGAVSAVGTVNVGSVTAEAPQAGVERMDVPVITEELFDSLRSQAQNSPNIYVDASSLGGGKGKSGGGGYDFSTSGDLDGAIVFVDGDVTVSGGIHNGSIIATGNITVNGSSSLTAGEIGVAMLSGGDIVMNGSSDSHGLFWSNGSFVQNGSSTVNGSIVSTGNITRNGTFNFDYDGIGTFDFLPTEPPRPIVVSWKEEE